jgi:hypothetical protein
VIVAAVVVARLSANKLADEGYRGLVRCTKCGHTERVNTFACFRSGWPEHCGETMELQKEPRDA